MYYGTSWYPEQWPESEWARDLSLMRETGMNVVRVAEFAWARTQPNEDFFDFDWLERAVNLAGEHGIQVIVGTGTPAPPAWLTQRYPETLSVGQDGSRSQHGGRCHYNPTNPRYLEFCANIAAKVGERFGSHHNVIGFQIDNEYGPMTYDDHAQSLFQEMLREEYGTLDELNRRWSNAYWSQTYSDWSQISLHPGYQNACALAAFRRFYTRVYRVYQANQRDALRPRLRSGQFITTNLHAYFADGDPHVIGREIDLVAYDNYLDSATLVPRGHLDHGQFGVTLDLCRGIQRKKFWQMETQAGHVKYLPVNNTVDPGETRRLVWHLVGHGAMAVMYWQWRACAGGYEQYWGTITNAGGQPRGIFDEVKKIGGELANFGSLLDRVYPIAETCILYSDANRHAIEHQRFHQDFNPWHHLELYYRALRRAGQNVDISNPADDLTPYQLVIAPHYHELREEEVDRMLDYVRAGGQLVLGARSGYKNSDCALLGERQPGRKFSEALGAEVREFYALENPVELEGPLGQGSGKIWGEWLEPLAEDCEILLRYGKANSWLDGRAAVVSRRLGAGRITYFGVWDEPKLMDALVRWAHRQNAFAHPPLNLPDQVEFSRLTGPDDEVLLVINHSTETFQVPGIEGWQKLLGSVLLPANEVGLFQAPRLRPNS
jgi:beta-galactosidase